MPFKLIMNIHESSPNTTYISFLSWEFLLTSLEYVYWISYFGESVEFIVLFCIVKYSINRDFLKDDIYTNIYTYIKHIYKIDLTRNVLASLFTLNRLNMYYHS